MKLIRKFFLFVLILSPLLSITGGNEFSTGLNLAFLLNVPSLNFLNYLFQLVFFFAFIAVNADKSNTNRVLVTIFIVIVVLTFWRHPTVFAALGLMSIFAALLYFMEDKAGATFLTDRELVLVYNIYWIYVYLSVAIHFYILATQYFYLANERMMGIFKNPNQLGFFLVSVYLLHQVKIRFIHKERFPLFRFVVLLVLVGLTGSRSALACIVLIHLMSMTMQRRAIYLGVIVILAAIAANIVIERIGFREFIEVVSRREAVAVESVGNSRWAVLQDIFAEFSALELAIGKDVSVGTNGMIYEQRESDSIVWLDSLVGVVLYNWGFLGLVFLLLLCVLEGLRHLPYLRKDYLVLGFFLVSAMFFFISDFFPLGFLIINLKNASLFERS